MKKILFAAVLMLSSASAFAQHAVGSFTLQPKVGINIASMTNIDDSKSRVDFVGGLEGEYQATDIFSISAGVLYSRQGVKWDNNYLDFADDSWSPSYINIPILANVYVVRGLAVKAGIQPGFMVDKDDAVNEKTFDFSIPVGLSYEYANFVLDARYNWGVTDVFDVESDSPKNSVFQITLGYKFDL
ncbi:MAG: porin family protein [Prevotella sp.]